MADQDRKKPQRTRSSPRLNVRAQPSAKLQPDVKIDSAKTKKGGRNEGKHAKEAGETKVQEELGKTAKVVNKRQKKGDKSDSQIKTVSQEENIIIIENSGKRKINTEDMTNETATHSTDTRDITSETESHTTDVTSETENQAADARDTINETETLHKEGGSSLDNSDHLNETPEVSNKDVTNTQDDTLQEKQHNRNDTALKYLDFGEDFLSFSEEASAAEYTAFSCKERNTCTTRATAEDTARVNSLASGDIIADERTDSVLLPNLARRPIHALDSFSGLDKHVGNRKANVMYTSRNEATYSSKDNYTRYRSSPVLTPQISQHADTSVPLTPAISHTDTSLPVTPVTSHTDIRLTLMLLLAVFVFCCICLRSNRYDLFISDMQAFISSVWGYL